MCVWPFGEKKKATNGRRIACMSFWTVTWMTAEPIADGYRHGCQVFLRCHPDEMAGNEMRQSNRLIHQPRGNITRHSLALSFFPIRVAMETKDRFMMHQFLIQPFHRPKCITVTDNLRQKRKDKPNDRRSLQPPTVTPGGYASAKKKAYGYNGEQQFVTHTRMRDMNKRMFWYKKSILVDSPVGHVCLFQLSNTLRNVE